jgi:hypothetical protein
LGNAAPHRDIARFTPVHIRQATFGSSAIGMYNVAIAVIISHKVGNDFAKSLWEQAFIYVFDGIMHIFFLAADPAFGVFILHGTAKLRREGECKKPRKVDFMIEDVGAAK